MRFHEIVDASNAVARTRSRLQKTAALADVLRRMGPDEVAVGVAYLSGALAQGRVGLGWSAISSARGTAAAATPSLDVLDVHTAFEHISRTSGSGAATTRARLLADLFSRATEAEQDFLGRLISGELRQGALAGVLTEAIAKAANVPADDVRQ